MQTELLNHQRWSTRVELANALSEYIEGFHNRRRRHSALRLPGARSLREHHPTTGTGSSAQCPENG